MPDHMSAPEVPTPDLPTPEQMEQVRAAFCSACNLSDESLIALTGRRSIEAGHYGVQGFEMEMQRRLMVSAEKLTGELVAFRELADSAAVMADDAAGKLTRLTGWLITFTVGLVVLTVVLVVLTVRLLGKG